MSDLLQRIKCPMGCSNSVFSESTKIIKENLNNLLLESGKSNSIKIKSYTCHCCGNSFEIRETTSNKNGKYIL